MPIGGAFGNAVFTVVTHFNFEVADALLNTQTLQNSVGSLSETAAIAQQRLAGLSVGFLASMGYIPASIMGAVGMAIKASEKYEQSRLKWANMFSAHKDKLIGPIDTFNQRLFLGEKTIKKIYTMANEFGMEGVELEYLTNQYTNEFIAKGIGGPTGDPTDFGLNFTRMLLKSAPMLAVDPMTVGNQLSRAMEGYGNMSDPLFRRLVYETPQMAQFGKGDGVEKFNKMSFDKRVEVLSEALNHFARDADVTAARVMTLTGQLNILKNNFSSANSVLKPVGDVLRKLVVQGLHLFNTYLDGPIRTTLVHLGAILETLAPDLEKVFLHFRHMSRSKDIVDTSASIMRFFGAVNILRWALATFAPMLMRTVGKFLLIGSVVAGFSMLIGTLAALPAMIAIAIPVLYWVGKIFLWLANAIILPTLALMFFIDIIKRAQGIAELADLKKLPELLGWFTQIGARISKAMDVIFGPINEVMNIWAAEISFIFEKSFWLSKLLEPMTSLAEMFESVAYWAIRFYASLNVVGAFFGYLSQLISDSLNFGVKHKQITGEESKKMFSDVFNETVNTMTKELRDGKLSVKHNTNINTVKIENKFKENLEPDRIAFTIRDQLQKLGQNALQGRASPTAFPLKGR